MTYRITPVRDYCNENSLSYPDFHLAGYDDNHFETIQEAAEATTELGDDVPWEVVECECENDQEPDVDPKYYALDRHRELTKDLEP